MTYILVPLMLFISSCLMALAWLGHLRFKKSPIYVAIFISWCIVLPEYVLNVLAIRYGHGTFTGAAMATFNLGTGVVCVALVSAYYLKEPLRRRQIIGFFLLTIAMVLIAWDSGSPEPIEESSGPRILDVTQLVDARTYQVDSNLPLGEGDVGKSPFIPGVQP